MIMIATLVWATLSVPFVVGLGTLLRSRSGSLTLTATLLSAGGLLLLGFGYYVGNGALVSIATAGQAPTPGSGAYQMAIFRSLWPFLADPGLMAWGGGQLLFGWLARNSDILPHRLWLVAAVGGLASVLASLLLPALAIPLAVIALASFAVWGLATGIVLLRTRAL
jgi:hypothetical protein